MEKTTLKTRPIHVKSNGSMWSQVIFFFIYIYFPCVHSWGSEPWFLVIWITLNPYSASVCLSFGRQLWRFVSAVNRAALCNKTKEECITLTQTVSTLLHANNTVTLWPSLGLTSDNYSQVTCQCLRPYLICCLLHWPRWKVFNSVCKGFQYDCSPTM